MFAAASLLVVILLALLITRVATVVLTLTGLSRETARFQARSALTGVGFTTSETEAVVNHPVRRRIVMALMLIGSAGVISVMTTLILSFAGTGGRGALWRILLLVGGLAGLVVLARSSAFDRLLQRLISRALARYTDLDVRVVLYGRSESVAEIDRRKAGPEGDEEHRRAMAEGVRV